MAETSVKRDVAFLFAGALIAGLVELGVHHLEAGPPKLPNGVSFSPDFRLSSDLNVCAWKLGTNPVPVVTTDRPPSVRIDGRCNTPFNADPKADAGVAAYDVASNDERSHFKKRIADGTEVVLHCYAINDVVADGYGVFGQAGATANSSNIWFEISKRPRLLIPNVNIGGGFTLSQIKELAIPPC